MFDILYAKLTLFLLFSYEMIFCIIIRFSYFKSMYITILDATDLLIQYSIYTTLSNCEMAAF